ncbi:MAG: Prolyl-tRNA synthetase [uncultured bacterium (gcode 4)]|uniref:Proline--tRNA ligase n=1 Tax=uncultured bacterium (gcode 4) TaxID=1234023 RepID=K2F4S6_9BACT|nr:MAG: Prolyl-tRNA synthetase [uncultured bacterium (gcode 4)]
MLQLSKFPFKTLKTVPGWSDNKWTWLLLQAWFIRQELAGAYNYLHFGLKTIEKIKQIIREELNYIWATEILLSSLSSKESWQKTWRWDTVDVLFKIEGSGKKQYALNPTHEEVITPLMQEFIQSYKDLNNCQVYQFQTKFRNEARAKSGVLRWREFIMKDLYSFHRNQLDLDVYFEKVHEAYNRIFDRLWIWNDTLYTFASGGVFSKYSYEFQTVLDIWEDDVYICGNCKQAHNEEIVEEKFICAECWSNEYKVVKTSEVWNIFKLSTKFSNAFGLKYTDEKWAQNEIVMWCYGIWVSRLMWVIAEKLSDEKWLVWPESISPFSHYLIVMWDNEEKALKLAKQLENEWKEIIIDDRDIWFWQKAQDADLLWIPNRIVISDKTIEKWWYELKMRNKDSIEIINF